MIKKINLADLNRVLYRCDHEERDDGRGFDVYNIPNYGSLVYAGLQGFVSLLTTVTLNNDLGHPMCENLRNGNWMIGKHNKIHLNREEYIMSECLTFCQFSNHLCHYNDTQKKKTVAQQQP